MMEVKIPAGEYYFIGDPCYCFENSWMKLLESSGYFNHPVGYVNDRAVVAFHTKHGDGIYKDQYGHEYPVDSGLIGITPISLIEGKHPNRENKKLGSVVFAYQDIIAKEENGVIYFGNTRIDTDFDDDWEE